MSNAVPLFTLGEYVKRAQPDAFAALLALVESRLAQCGIGIQPAVKIDWEVLPPEKFEKVFEALPPLGCPSRRGASRAMRTREETFRFLASLGPKAWAVGRYLGRRHYMVALFENAAVAECRLYGNALYCVPFGSWQDVLCRTKADAKRLGATKITHHEGWQERLRLAIQQFTITAASP